MQRNQRPRQLISLVAGKKYELDPHIYVINKEYGHIMGEVACQKTTLRAASSFLADEALKGKMAYATV